MRTLPIFVVIAAAGIAAVATDRHIIKRRDPVIRATAEWRELARRIDAIPGERPLIIDVGAPMGLQMFLQIHQPQVSIERALEAAGGDRRVLVASPRDGQIPGRVVATLPDPAGRGAGEIEVWTNDADLVLPP